MWSSPCFLSVEFLSGECVPKISGFDVFTEIFVADSANYFCLNILNYFETGISRFAYVFKCRFRIFIPCNTIAVKCCVVTYHNAAGKISCADISAVAA